MLSDSSKSEKKYSNPRRILKMILTKAIELNAKVCGNVFYCRALSGEAFDNSVSINCDMSVSCFDHDHDNSGYIGDFSKNTMDQIFGGDIACSKRLLLKQGILPTNYCHSCEDLIRIPKNSPEHIFNSFVLPHRGLMVENTIFCNLSCKCCNRQHLKHLRKKSIMSVSDIKKIAIYLRENKVESLSFFKLGEPFADSFIYDELYIIRKHNPHMFIKLSTNGALLNSDIMRDAALIVDFIEFSIDGINDEMINKYQVGHSFNNAYNNLLQLIQYRNRIKSNRTHIAWKYVVFAHNDKPAYINTAINYAKEAGCNSITFCPANVPIRSYSFRYRLHPFYRTLGQLTEKGRYVTLDPSGGMA